MNRSEVIAKIKKLMALKDGSSFDGEASAAAAMIDKLCRQYGVTADDAIKPQILNEIFEEFGKLNAANFRIISAVAYFYDSMAYTSGKTFKVIGSEAQQIQVKLYYEYIKDCMELEADKAYKAEKILADLMGKELPNRTFKHQFRLAFADKVRDRLHELKIAEGRVHEHRDYALEVVKKMRFRNVTLSAGHGEGAMAGSSAGNSVSLHRQTSGSSHRQLCGG